MFSDLAKQILAHVVSQIQDVPAYQIVNPGPEPAVDCEMIYVGYAGASTDYLNGCASALNISFHVGTFREICVEEDLIPNPVDLTTDGVFMGDDAWQLLQALNCWNPSGPGDPSGRLADLTPLDPMGKFAGMYWTYVVRISL